MAIRNGKKTDTTAEDDRRKRGINKIKTERLNITIENAEDQHK